jgi:sugar phosphate isomerase/epimerase
MRIGIADYGMNVWDGGAFDLEKRLADLKRIGYDGIERLTAVSEADALKKAARFRRLGMNFTTCRGPDQESGIQWTAGLGKSYVWSGVKSGRDADFDVYCRQVNTQVETCRRWGLQVGLHNHLGQRVQNHDELIAFLKGCPGAGLVFDTGHHAAAGGDPVEIIRDYADRLLVVHVKDWLVTDPAVGLESWSRRGRFCELGAGNLDGFDNAVVLKALLKAGYDGWIFVEHDTHLRDPLEDLALSRKFIRDAMGG